MVECRLKLNEDQSVQEILSFTEKLMGIVSGFC